MAQPLFVDLRGVYPPEEVEEAGLRWFGIGRPRRDAGEPATAAPAAR
jgi:hypothetical protein